MKTEDNQVGGIDSAQTVDSETHGINPFQEKNVGGIDLNSDFMNLETNKDTGYRIQDAEDRIPNTEYRMPNMEGLVPVILNIQALMPAAVPMLLGFMPPSSSDTPVRVTSFQEGIPGENLTGYGVSLEGLQY